MEWCRLLVGFCVFHYGFIFTSILYINVFITVYKKINIET